MDVVYTVLVFVYGVIIGSFLNVCIYRIPQRTSLLFGRSYCPHCDSMIRAYDNVPVLSYLLLRGRCRVCGGPISPRYPMVEVLAGAVEVGLYRVYGIGPDFLAYTVLATLLIVVAFIDLDHRIVPNRLTLPGIVVGLVFAPFLDTVSFRESVIGLFAGGGALLALALIGHLVFKRESMGGGDIKLAAMIGAFVGWKLVLISLFFASVAGSIGGVIWIATSSEGERTIPFAPFIALGTLCALLWGERLLGLYLRTW